MHSTVGVRSSREEDPMDALAVELRLIDTVRVSRRTDGFRRIVMASEVLVDLLTITASIALGYIAYYHLALGKHIYYTMLTVWGAAFAFAVVMVLMLDRAGAYGHGNSLLRVRETEQVLRVSAQAFLIALAISFSSGFLFSRWLLALCFALVPLALFAEKGLIYV